MLSVTKQERRRKIIWMLNSSTDKTKNKNVKIQLLSIVCGKDEDEQYKYKQNELLEMFEGISLNDIKKARQHAVKATSVAPIEPRKFCCKKLTDAQINHLLDFIHFGGVIRDVARGIWKFKLSTGWKINIPNVARTVHKAKAIPLRISACEVEVYTQENGCPSKHTFWNILNNYPASQAKSLADLDNVASDGSDSFDKLIKICKNLQDKTVNNLAKKLTEVEDI